MVVGYPAPSKPELFKDDNEITFSGDCDGDNTKTCKHVISDAQYMNSGTYKCVGRNTVGGDDKPDTKTVNITIGTLIP